MSAVTLTTIDASGDGFDAVASRQVIIPALACGSTTALMYDLGSEATSTTVDG